MDTWDKIVISGRALAVFLLVLVVLALVGCAGSVTKKNLDGSVEEVPAAVAVIQASAKSHASCGQKMPSTLSVSDISKLSASAQAEYMRNVPMMMMMGLLQDKDGGCHAQVASATREYFRSQSTKYQQWGLVGRAGVVGGFTYLGAKSLFDAFASMGTVGDTNISEVNISGEAGAGGEGAGGSNTMNTNIGGSQQILSGGSAISGTKAQVPAGDLSDDDGNNSTLNSDGLF